MPVSALSEITDSLVGKPTNPGDTPEREAAIQQRLQYAGLYKQVTAGAAGATAAVEVSRVYPLTLMVTGGVSSNKAWMEGSIDNSTWQANVGAAVSGAGSTVTNVSGAYRYVRGMVNTWSSGTVTFDVFGIGK